MIRVNMTMAFKALKSNRLRSALTILGIVIGITSVISMLSIGQGAQKSISSSISQMGTNALMIRSGTGGPGLVRSGTSKSLTMDDVRALEKGIHSPVALAPVVSTRVQAKHLTRNTNTTLTGVTLKYLVARNYQIDSGRGFTQTEMVGLSKVCILGKAVSDALFSPDEDPIGQPIRVNQTDFQVIGIYKEKGNSGWTDEDDRILAPFLTAQKRFMGTEDVGFIFLDVQNQSDTPFVMQRATEILRKAHHLREDQEDDFSIRSQQELLDTAESVTKSFTILLGSIALISLLVGGIGIMNILLVSVTERTKEIGIRKAIGAYERDILMQFLAESIVLCGIGGLVGIVLGVGVTVLLSSFSNWPLVISPFSVLLALGVSFSTGIFFGYYPAKKAATMNPVDALRYE